MNNYTQQIQNLLKEMTLREKLAQMSQTVAGYRCFERNGEEFALKDEFKNFIRDYGAMGAISNFLRADGFTQHNWGTGIEPRHRVKFANMMQKYILDNARVKIPVLVEVEANHGVHALGSTVFPTNLCIGSSFNPGLYSEMMDTVGKEIELSANHIGFVTMLDVARDPRWGRTEELFSEDPYLISEFAKAGVEGFKKNNALICCKHYCAAGDCFGGMNTEEVNVGIRELHDIHLPPTEKAVKAGADIIMAAYNTVDGVPCHINSYLLRDVLRKQMGFKGITLSDGWAVPRVIEQMGQDPVTGAANVLKAGIDLSLADAGAYLKLEAAAEEGLADIKLIDESVTRILEKKCELGLFDNPYIKEDDSLSVFFESGIQKKLAYEMAAESVVLLKNNGILPIDNYKRVALIGEHAADIYYQLGDYTPFVDDRARAIKDVFKETLNLSGFTKGWSFTGDTEDFDNALRLCEESDVIIVTIGGSTAKNNSNLTYDFNNGAAIKAKKFLDCGEGMDISDISLPGNQLELIEILKRIGKPIIALLIAGRPYDITRVSEIADAVLTAWYPGEEGGRALSDILTGKVNPSGRLSVSVPYAPTCLPAYYNRITSAQSSVSDDWVVNTYGDNNKRVLYPFGYGLSYSDFEYVSMEVTEKGACLFEVKAVIRNVSDIGGKEAVQLYIHGKGNSVRRRVKELKGFKKIYIAPHSEQTVTFTLGYDELKIFSCNNRYELENGKVEIYIGSGDNLPLRTEIEIRV